MYHETVPDATIIWYYDYRDSLQHSNFYELAVHFNSELQGRVKGSS